MLPPLLAREPELRRLLGHWAEAESGRPGLVAVYGRRQVGKTFLMRHVQDRLTSRGATLYFTALQSGTPRLQLDAFRRVVAVAVGADTLVPESFRDWREALRFVVDHATRQPTLLVLDEVPYLVEADRTFASVVQQMWDELRVTSTPVRLLLVLTGSAMATMLSLLAAGSGAVFGRVDDEVRIRPFTLLEAREHVLVTSLPEDVIEAYAATGGYPRHLLSWDQDSSTSDNLLRLYGRPGGLLLRNGRQLLADVPADGGYRAVLSVVGAGEHRRAAIGGRVGQRVDRPLELLQRSLLLRHERPAGSPPSTPGHYLLADPFLACWYALCDGDEEDIETGLGPEVLRRRQGRWARHVADVFEEEARRHARRLQENGDLPRTDALGRWWNASAEIDVLGLTGRRSVMVGEAKWQAAPLTPALIGTLRAKRSAAPDPLPDCVLATWSRGGGSDALRAQGVLTYNAADLLRP
jgi:hypothetical protein